MAVDKQTGRLRMGWDPSRIVPFGMEGIREEALLYLLGIGSPTHRFRRRAGIVSSVRPLKSAATIHWPRTSIHASYSQAWLALNGLRDGQPFEIDYFQNSVVATYAHRAYC